MIIKIAHEIDIENVLSNVNGPTLDRTANPNAETLMKNFVNGVRQNQDELSVSRVQTVANEDAVSHFHLSSAFMMYQLIETTPHAKKSLLKYATENKEQIIKDIEHIEELEEMTEIIQKTPANLKQETISITQILSLANSEYDQTIRPYTDALLSAFPPLRKWVDSYNQRINKQIEYRNSIVDVITKDSFDIEHTDIKRILDEFNVDVTTREFIEFVKSQGLETIHRLKYEDLDIKRFDIDSVKTESKKLNNTHSQKRTIQHNEENEPFEYTLRDMYFIGALIFLDEYLCLMTGSEYVFQSKSELRAYLQHSNTIHELYLSETPLERVKATKAKARPLRVHNGETFGNVLQFALDKEHSRTWTQLIIAIYTQLNLRGDVLWNTVLEKKDIDTVTQLLNQWHDVVDEKSSVDENKPLYFIVGLLIIALEKQQQQSDNYMKETIIRMDEERERELTRTIDQKEQRIAHLNNVVEKQNSALYQMDSLQRKNAQLEEKLSWLEERIEQEDEMDKTTDNNAYSDSIDTNDIRNRLNSDDVCFMGGDINWQTALKQELPEATFQLAEESNRSMRHVEKSKIIIYNTATMNHGLFYRFKNSLKRNTKDPIVIYLNTQSSNKLITYQRIGKQLQKYKSEVML